MPYTETLEAHGMTTTVERWEPSVISDAVLHCYRVTMIDQRHQLDDVLIEFNLYDGSYSAFDDRLDVEMITRGMTRGRWAWTQDYKTVGGADDF